jgi:hypothetical protein
VQPTEADIEAAKAELVQDILGKLEEVSRVAALLHSCSSLTLLNLLHRQATTP